MQEGFSVPFAYNADPKCACVLLLDVSSSMRGEPIDQLNAGLRAFQDAIQQDELARRRVEIAIVTFGNLGDESVQLVQDFVAAESFVAPTLTTGMNTPMGEAITTALDMVHARKAYYRASGMEYYRPWILLLTDGQPTDDWQAAAQRVHAEESAKGVAFFAVGVGQANLSTLQQIVHGRTPLRLQGLNFQQFFIWLSASMGRVAASRPGEEVQLEAPTGWASI
jgi:uncharacterized protein YegL